MWKLHIDCFQHCTCYVETLLKIAYKRTLNYVYILFVLRPLALLLIACILLFLNASITYQLARLFTAMKYTACLVDQCLQCGMMFFDVTAFARICYYWPIFLLFKTKSSVKQSNNNYNSNASVKLIFVVFAF